MKTKTECDQLCETLEKIGIPYHIQEFIQVDIGEEDRPAPSIVFYSNGKYCCTSETKEEVI